MAEIQQAEVKASHFENALNGSFFKPFDRYETMSPYVKEWCHSDDIFNLSKSCQSRGWILMDSVRSWVRRLFMGRYSYALL